MAVRQLTGIIVDFREMSKDRLSTTTLIRKLPFRRLVREISREAVAANSRDMQSMADLRFNASAMQRLQEATEAYMALQMSKWNLAGIHAGRLTIFKEDAQFIRAVEDG